MDRFDSTNGGFGGAPKFPQEATLYFLLEQAQRTGDKEVLAAAHYSLQKMAAGGIHDQIGGGFHRYSVDDHWLVPHFEKMLYNQAALSRNYTQAFALTADVEHARTAKAVLDYVLREMTTSDGVFYSATDADSRVPEDAMSAEEFAEGAFFIWTPDELESVLGADDADMAASYWGVTEAGNFEYSNILYRPQPAQAIANKLNMSPLELQTRMTEIANRLRVARDLREPPLRDDKIITAWNAMMISAFAEAADTFNDAHYLDVATRAAIHLWQNLRSDTGKLWRTSFNGRVSVAGTHADYAYLAEAMLSLHDVDDDGRWLQHASELADAMIEQFWDVKQGGFFMGAATVAGATLVTRPKDIHDASTPSGNAVALRVLARLHRRTGEARYGDYADQLIAAMSASITDQPAAFYYFLTGLSEHLFGETGARQYAARGIVKATATRKLDRIEVTIEMAPGWHVNANQPLQDYLIGTQLTGSEAQPLKDIRYPDPMTRTLGFQQSELSLYEGQITVSAALPADALLSDEGQSSASLAILPLNLQLQACSDEICLAPENLILNLSLASLDNP